MKKNSVLLIIILFSVFINAQNDTLVNNEKPLFDGAMSHKINTNFIEEKVMLDAKATIKSTDLSYLFTPKENKKLGLSYQFNKNKYLNPNKKSSNKIFLMQQPMEKDIMVVKHFNGNNTTFKKFSASQNLGTIESNTEFVRIEYRDFGTIDGDRVKVYLNEKVIDVNVHLDGLFYTLHIKLDKKGYNKIDIEAINQGMYGPNTAEFVIYDDKGNVISHKSWNLKTNQMATLGIVKY